MVDINNSSKEEESSAIASPRPLPNYKGNLIMRTWRRANHRFLITPKLLYFFLNVEFYAFYTFRGSFIKNYLKLSPLHYGALLSIMACVSFPFMSVWGRVADWLGRPKVVLAALALGTAGAFELLAVRLGAVGSTTHFAWVIFSIIVYSIFSSGLIPLMDTIALRILAKQNLANSKDLYGRQRLWGSIGYIVSNYLAAFVMESLGDGMLFILIPICAAVFTVVLFVAGPNDDPKPIFRQRQRRTEPDVEKKEIEQEDEVKEKFSLRKWWRSSPVLKLLLNPGYLFFLGAVFMTGSARSIMTNYLALYWEHEMLGSRKNKKPLVAVLTTFGVVVEILIFFFAPYLSFLGNYWMLLLAQLAMLLRGWLYVILPPRPSSFPAACAIELLKGMAFGFTQVAGVKVASESASPELQATSQAIYTSIYSQLPAVIAAFLGGTLYYIYGARLLFAVTASISTASFVAFFLKWSWDGSIPTLRCCRKRRSTSA